MPQLGQKLRSRGPGRGPSAPTKAPMKHPNGFSGFRRILGTFSHTTYGNEPVSWAVSISWTSLTYPRVSWPRASASERRRPADENGWHGVPPMRTSMGGSAATSSCVKSPCKGIFGKRVCRTARGKSAISLYHWACQPRGSNATDAASMPEQIDPNFIGRPYGCRVKFGQNGLSAFERSDRNVVIAGVGPGHPRRLTRNRGGRPRPRRSVRALDWGRGRRGAHEPRRQPGRRDRLRR